MLQFIYQVHRYYYLSLRSIDTINYPSGRCIPELISQTYDTITTFSGKYMLQLIPLIDIYHNIFAR